jgi:CHASE3 domain sensor protein
MKLSLYFAGLYLILIAMGIISYINYKKCRIQFSAIIKASVSKKLPNAEKPSPRPEDL